jgi:hypothetical protein
MKTQNTYRHSYAIKVLGKLPGLFQPQRYAYYCVRCKWSFVVNDGKRGVVTALDVGGKQLERVEAAERVATFTDGPCPAMKILSQPVPRPVISTSFNGASNGNSNGASTNGVANGSTPIPMEQYRHREPRRRVNSYLS